MLEKGRIAKCLDIEDVNKIEGTNLEYGHVLEARQFTREWLEQEFFPLVGEMGDLARKGGDKSLEGYVLCSLFYQPSTRTRFSFELAMILLGGKVISTEAAQQFSSAAKGEILEDTIGVLNRYFVDIMGGKGVIVLRHPEEEAARRAAAVSRSPIINGGAGLGEHPSQALVDIYTIKRKKGEIDGLTIGFCGDLTGRAVNSLVYLLGKFKDVRLILVSHESSRIRQEIKVYLDRQGVGWEESGPNDLENVVGYCDAWYLARDQREYKDSEVIKLLDQNPLIFDTNIVGRLKPDAVILHPLPRTRELPDSVIKDPRVHVFEQAGYGVPVRMALLKLLLG